MKKTFRFKVKDWDEIEEKEKEDKGFITAASYGKAISRIEKIYTTPKGECNITEISIYEIEAFDENVIFDSIIEETQADEIKNGK